VQPTIPITGPLGLGDLLDGAFRLLRARFSKLVLTAAIFLVPVALLVALVFGVAVGGAMQMALAVVDQPVQSEGASAFGVLGALFLVTAAGYIGAALAYVSLTSQIFAYLGGEDISVGEGIRRGVRRLLPFIGMAVIYAVAIGVIAFVFFLGVMIVVFVVMAIFGVLLSTVTDNTIVNIGITLLMFFFIFLASFIVLAPMTFLSACWIVAPVAVVGEHEGPTSALARSWALTRHNVWRCVGYLVLLFVLNYVLIGLPINVVQWVALIVLPPQIMGWLSGVLLALSYFFSILWYPFLALSLVLLYFDLRVRNESYDLDVRISQLEDSVRPAKLP
jgi:hypothetical protein